MNNLPILNHIKHVKCQNEQLFTTINKIDYEVIQLTKKVEMLDDELHKMRKELDLFSDTKNDTITMADLENVISDVKDSLEYILCQTPRNNNEIDNLKKMMDQLNERIEMVEKVDEIPPEILPPKISVKEIPKLNLSIKKKK